MIAFSLREPVPTSLENALDMMAGFPKPGSGAVISAGMEKGQQSRLMPIQTCIFRGRGPACRIRPVHETGIERALDIMFLRLRTWQAGVFGSFVNSSPQRKALLDRITAQPGEIERVIRKPDF